MDIRDQIREACLKYLGDNGIYPTVLYLGMNQCSELDQIMADEPGNFHVALSAFVHIEGRRKTWTTGFGFTKVQLTIYSVNAYSHLQVGTVR